MKNVSYNTLEQSQEIKSFLIENKEIFNISKLTVKLGLKKNRLSYLIYGSSKTLNPEDIRKVMPFLTAIGFKDSSNKHIDIDYIIRIVCLYFNVPIEMMQSNTRKREIVQARQIAMYFSKKLTKESLATIGNKIGDKDHATVLHSCKTVNNLIETDKRFRAQMDEIENQLKK